MFKLGRVQANDLEAIARRAEKLTVTYDEVGATLRDEKPSGFRHNRYEISLPDRVDAFERGVDGIRQWAPHHGAGLTVAPASPPHTGDTVAVAAPVGPLTAVAVCRIVAVIDEPNRYGFAYGTLPGHPERGEEAFIVQRHEGRVLFEVNVFSKPDELLARLGGPITRRIQSTTTRRYLGGLASFVRDA